MKYASYFLIVADYIKWAKNNAILVGPGRGSGARGRCCGRIKKLRKSPIKFNLIF